jgi:hypothetical protein
MFVMLSAMGKFTLFKKLMKTFVPKVQSALFSGVTSRFYLFNVITDLRGMK